jgi:hypothetical protein
LAVTYRGYSGSEGAPSQKGFMIDAQAALKFLLDEGYKFSGQGSAQPAPLSQSEVGQAVTVTGKSVTLTANLLQLAAKSTTLTIIGNETGGRVVVNVTVRKQTLNTTPNVPLTGNAPISLP